jgi:formamidopyrimidine-DNA glycosylase
MPELPEVETIKNELAPQVTGRTFSSVIVKDDKPLRKITDREFASRLKGKKILDLARRGKYLIFHLSGGWTLIVHLRMTGNLLIDPNDVTRFVRVVFELDNRARLVFADRRRLGVMYLVKDEDEVVGKLGFEPFTADFTKASFAEKLKKRSGPIKAVLLDQHLVAGVGNMYADEALFAAKIHPLKKANELSKSEISRLYDAILDVLREAIANKGASVDTYVRPSGSVGNAADNFKVAHRLGQRCPRCGTPIERLMIRNRGSYYCPKCQKQ